MLKVIKDKTDSNKLFNRDKGQGQLSIERLQVHNYLTLALHIQIAFPGKPSRRRKLQLKCLALTSDTLSIVNQDRSFESHASSFETHQLKKCFLFFYYCLIIREKCR